jgi:hypothetical protein
VVVRGRRREDGTEIYLGVEVSWGVGLHDVQRAAERAALLARLGTPALPVVGGGLGHPRCPGAGQGLACVAGDQRACDAPRGRTTQLSAAHGLLPHQFGGGLLRFAGSYTL